MCELTAVPRYACRELHDRASADPATVARLTALLKTVMDPQAIDSRAKQVQRDLFLAYGAYGLPINRSNCGDSCLLYHLCLLKHIR